MVRKGDTVTVLTGKDKSKSGKVLKVFEKGRRVLVEKINMIKKHNKPTQTNPTGGIVEKEAPMDISNVQLFCSSCNKGVRTGAKLEKNKKVRVCKKCGKNI